MQETAVRSLGQEDPLEKEMATHSSIFAWKNSMDRGIWQATVHRIAKSWTPLSEHACTHVLFDTLMGIFASHVFLLLYYFVILVGPPEVFTSERRRNRIFRLAGL